MAAHGLVIAGLSSGSGKTTITLGLLRALNRRGSDVVAAKTGPDYIDAAFLTAAARRQAINLDCFAMPADVSRTLAADSDGDTLIIEGVMGLFDGTVNGAGSTAHLAQQLKLPIVLVIDARHQAQTAAAIASGLRHELGDDVPLAGVILNRIASSRHLGLIADALKLRNIPLLGALPVDETISIPSRHLGLVQASDLSASGQLETVIDGAADLVSKHIDLDQLLACATNLQPPKNPTHIKMPAPGQRIAIATDTAFGFSYAHLIAQWQGEGAEIIPFSPLNDEPPCTDADFIFLPGGYPELHLPTLSTASNFITAMQAAAQKNISIYGECGGFMTLGKAIIDSKGQRFEMLGLLDLETSFKKRKLNLGYRRLTPTGNATWPPANYGELTAHEFHYTSATAQTGPALFTATDAAGNNLGAMGLVSGSVSGSYAHIIA